MLLPIDLHFYLFGTPQGFFLSVVGAITVASSCTACRTITVVLAVWIVCITVCCKPHYNNTPPQGCRYFFSTTTDGIRLDNRCRTSDTIIGLSI